MSKGDAFSELLDQLNEFFKENRGRGTEKSAIEIIVMKDEIINNYRAKIMELAKTLGEREGQLATKRAECTMLSAQVTELTARVEELTHQRDAANAEVECLKQKS